MDLQQAAKQLYEHVEHTHGTPIGSRKLPKFSRGKAVEALVETQVARDASHAAQVLARMLQARMIEESSGTVKRRLKALKKGRKEAAAVSIHYRFERGFAAQLAGRGGDEVGDFPESAKVDGHAEAEADNDELIAVVAQLSGVAGVLASLWVGSVLGREPLVYGMPRSFWGEVVSLAVAAISWTFFFGDVAKKQEVHRFNFDTVQLEHFHLSAARQRAYDDLLQERVDRISLEGRALDEVVEEVLELYRDEQLLRAGDLLHALEEAMGTGAFEGEAEAEAMLQRERGVLSKLMARHEDSVLALVDFRGDDGSGRWISAGTVHGSKVWRKKDAHGDLWVKVDGVLDCDPLHCLAVWREGDLYHKWFPAAQFSQKVDTVGRAELVVYFGGAVMSRLMAQDCVIHGWAVDNLAEGYFLLVGESVDQWPPGSKDPLPEAPASYYHRLHVDSLKILVEPLDDGKVRSSLICSMRLDYHVPQWILMHAIKNVFGMIFHNMQAECDRIRDNDEESTHAGRIRQDRKVYRDWLEVRVRKHLRDKCAAEAALAAGLSVGPKEASWEVDSNGMVTPVRGEAVDTDESEGEGEYN